MSKKVQLKDVETNEDIFPLTNIESVDDLERRLKEIESRPSGGGGDSTFDDALLKQWVKDNYIAKGEIDITGFIKTSEVESKLSELKSEILGGAGEDYDTLKKIEEWVAEHEDLYSGLISAIAEKASKDEIKDMATITYVDGEVETLTEELNKKANVVVCDNQYEFDQIKTKDNNTIYLIKGDQDQWFSKEDGDELYDFYGELRERVAHLERLNGITDYESEYDADPEESEV